MQSPVCGMLEMREGPAIGGGPLLGEKSSGPVEGVHCPSALEQCQCASVPVSVKRDPLNLLSHRYVAAEEITTLHWKLRLVDL